MGENVRTDGLFGNKRGRRGPMKHSFTYDQMAECLGVSKMGLRVEIYKKKVNMKDLMQFLEFMFSKLQKRAKKLAKKKAL